MFQFEAAPKVAALFPSAPDRFANSMSEAVCDAFQRRTDAAMLGTEERADGRAPLRGEGA